jgi:hypothetical protein
VLDPVITVPLSPVMDAAKVAQSPEKDEGVASDNCGSEESPPHPTSSNALMDAIAAANFDFELHVMCIVFFQVDQSVIIYIL